MRGKLVAELGELSRQGITPACAGKTYVISNVCPKDKDHPRVCGENEFADDFAKGARGSPPRVRGKPESKKIFHT